MKTILPRHTQVNVPLIRKTLCGNENKMPKDFTFNGQHKLFDRHGNDLGFWTLSVKAHVPHPHGRSASKHRIFAVVDGVEFPIGRLTQAHHPKHKNKEMLNPTPAQVKHRNRKWAKALLTSEKIRGQMHRRVPLGDCRATYEKHCCLGVAEDVGVEMSGGAITRSRSAYPSLSMMRFFGWESENPQLKTAFNSKLTHNSTNKIMVCAATLNDGLAQGMAPNKAGGYTHKEISVMVVDTFVRPNKKAK